MSACFWLRLIGPAILITAGFCAAASAPKALGDPVPGPVLYVDDDAPGDPGPGDPIVSDPAEDGSPEHPFDAIQKAIDAAGDGWQIEVADGSYSGPGNRDIDFGGRAIMVRAARRLGSAIHCGGSPDEFHRGFYLHSDEPRAAVIEGFVIMEGHAPYGGGIYCSGSSPTIRDCVITCNSALWGGGAIYCASSNPVITDCLISANSASEFCGGAIYCSNSSPTISNCQFDSNLAVLYGGAIHSYFQSNPTISDCVLVYNQAVQGAAIASMLGSTPAVTNCTLIWNYADTGRSLACGSDEQPGASFGTFSNSILWNGFDEITLCDSESTVTVRYSDVFIPWEGTGNLSLYPEFLDEMGHLGPGSPCADAGDPDSVSAPCAIDVEGRLRIWDGDDDGVARIDMGAYELGSFAYGDLNCDGLVNAFDIDPFIQALIDPAWYAVAFPECSALLADSNCDGLVNAFDIDPFVELLTGGR